MVVLRCLVPLPLIAIPPLCHGECAKRTKNLFKNVCVFVHKIYYSTVETMKNPVLSPLVETGPVTIKKIKSLRGYI